MKTFYFTEKQIQLIKENLCSEPSSTAFKDVFTDGYNGAKNSFNDNIETVSIGSVIDKLNSLITTVQEKESKISEQLEKLCADVVSSCFDINGINYVLECNLVNGISKTKAFNVSGVKNKRFEYDNVEQIENISKEEQRRKNINILTLGGALCLTDKLLNKCIGKIFELDEELPHLYSKIIKINNYLLYASDDIKITDEDNKQDAYVDVSISDSMVKIKAEGIIFPFLLTETIRGFIEVLSSAHLPEDKLVANKIINDCDTLENEPFFMKAGMVLWKRIIDNGDVKIKEYEQLYNELFSMGSESLENFMEEIIFNTKDGKEECKKLIEKVKHDKGYSDFEKDLKKKQEKNSLLINDEFLGDDFFC